LLDKIILKDSIKFDGKPTELKELIRLKKDREFRLEWIDESTFKFVSNFSIGTLIVNYLPIEGIKGFAKLSELESGKTNVELTTKIRIELYFFTAISLVLGAVGIFSKEPWPIWAFGLFPLGLIWFWWVYRLQEKGLFKRLKKYINT
jgi:hypothetical protein